MSTYSIEEAFAMIEHGRRAGYEYFFLDAVAGCLYETYDDGIGGNEIRQDLMMKRPSIFEDLKEVNSPDDLAAIIVRYKVEMGL